MKQREAWHMCSCGCGLEVGEGSKAEKGVKGIIPKEKVAALGRISTGSSPKHGHARNENVSPEYRSWRSMINRCNRATDKSFAYYGGRGITICERWMKFENFLADMGPRPPETSIDRIDNNGNYEPSNCRWATRSEQQRNKRPLYAQERK